MRDRYDQEVERLTKGPQWAIVRAWRYGEAHSPLFDPCGHDRSDNSSYGCLTEVASTDLRAETEKLTRAIRRDKSIPHWEGLITAAELPTFARWQRRIDKELDRTPPEMLPE